jgi:hypothetical protein
MMRPRGTAGLGRRGDRDLARGTGPCGLGKCQKGAREERDKLRGAIWKALAKCKDGYQGPSPCYREGSEALSVKAGPSCQLGLDKVLNAGNTPSPPWARPRRHSKSSPR